MFRSPNGQFAQRLRTTFMAAIEPIIEVLSAHLQRARAAGVCERRIAQLIVRAEKKVNWPDEDTRQLVMDALWHAAWPSLSAEH